MSNLAMMMGLGSGAGGTPWLTDLSVASYDSVSFSVSAQEINATDLTFNTDGTKMFITGYTDDEVVEYALSTGFDISTASHVRNFPVGSQETNPNGLDFNPDGTKMYICGNGTDRVYQYSLTTGFDLSTASYDSKSFSVASQDTAPRGMALNNDGTKMFVVGGSGNDVSEYALSTAYDVSTASYTTSFSVVDTANEANPPHGITFNPDGTKMYIVGRLSGSTQSVVEYDLTTGFDLSTASYNSVNFSVQSTAAAGKGIAFNTDGSKMYIIGLSADKVFQYTTA